MTSGGEIPDISFYKLNVTFRENHLEQIVENGETIVWRKETELGKEGLGFGCLRLEKAVIAGKESWRAVKSVSRDFYINHKLDFKSELQALIMVQDHTDLFLEFLGWYEDDFRFFRAMEYAAFGDLGSYIKEFKEDTRLNATSITQQLLEALVLLHERKLFHCNLKPSNVLIISVSPLRVKLIGFETSQSEMNSRLKSSYRATPYSAPEMIGCLNLVHQPEREYPAAVDIWALGCLVHEILTGETLFLDHDFAGTVEEPNPLVNTTQHLKILISFCLEEAPLPTEGLEKSGADTEAIDFIKQLLVARPDSRPSAMEALDHVWLLGCRFYEKFKLETAISEEGVVHTTLDATNEAITTEWVDVRVIGRGGFGTVSLQKGVVRGVECGFRAVKRVHKDFHKLGLSREVAAMIAVKDRPEMFVQLLGWFEAFDCFCIAMEYLEYGDLDGYLLANGKRMRPQIVDITRQILKGLVVLHRRNICHRDLKPQNVLIASLSPVQVKLADFGISKTTVGTLLRTRVGSSGYLAPELQGLGPRTRHDNDVYTNAIDMWSMGCMVYKMFTVSKLPFMLEEDSYSASMSSFMPESNTSIQPSVNITLLLDFCRGTTDLPLGPLREADVSEKGIDFLKRLLAPDPRSRMKATTALGHRWFTEPEPKSLDELERIKDEIISLKKDPVQTESLVLAYGEGGNSDTIHNIIIAMEENPESLARKASDKGYTLLLDMLLKVFKKSSDILIPTSLQTAAKRGHLPVVELLLTYGADLNAGPGDICQGRTALQSAAEYGHLHLVTFLIHNGADIYSKPAQTGGLTTLQAAASRGHLVVLRSLIIEHKVDVNEEPCKVNGRTALQAAAENGHIAAVDFLLHNGAKVNAVPCDQKGRTALQAAAGNGHFTIVKMLLENSAAVNASPCSSFGRTALQAAAEKGHNKVVRYLLESLADVNAEPCRKKGKTALWAAAEGGHFEVVRLLLENRADINCDRCGSTASEIAEENGHFDIAEFISEF